MTFFLMIVVVLLCHFFHASSLETNVTGINKFFLGGAFGKGLSDLASQPNAWSTTRGKSGYWLHPMGFDAARQGGYLNTLLGRYAVKSYVYEADLMGWTDGSNPTQTNSPWCWGKWLEEADPSYKQAFFAPWVAGDRIANNLQDTTNRYIDLHNRMKGAGYPHTYFFYAPPSPESINNINGLLNGRVDGMPLIEYAIKHAGLTGIVLDYPAGLYLAKDFPANFPPGSADLCRKLAAQAWNIAQRNNIPLVWVFNGGDSNTRQAMNAIHGAGIYPTSFAVDNFADAGRPGTPETTQSSMSGQLMQLF